MGYSWISNNINFYIFIYLIKIKEVFRSIVKSFYKGATAIILAYDPSMLFKYFLSIFFNLLIRDDSFKNLENWEKDINANTGKDCIKVLAAT